MLELKLLFQATRAGMWLEPIGFSESGSLVSKARSGNDYMIEKDQLMAPISPRTQESDQQNYCQKHADRPKNIKKNVHVSRLV